VADLEIDQSNGRPESSQHGFNVSESERQDLHLISFVIQIPAFEDSHI
jgi:hypothetical protein